MTQVYFHCSNAKKVVVDHRGAVVNDLAEARGLIFRSATSRAHSSSRWGLLHTTI
jgi:hypothetical protein